jgi:hypothetical protein
VGDFKQVGVMFPHEDITNITYDNCTVNFDLKVPSAVKIYDRSFVPFKGSGVTEEAKERFLSLTDNVMIPLIDMTPENAFVFQKMAINNQRWVVILGIDKGNETDKNLFQVFGIETGLYVKSKQADKANQAYLLVSLVQHQSKYPDLFFFANDKATTDTKIDSWLTHDAIYGGTIENGGSVKLTIDSGKTGYVKLPNGNVLTTVSGIIDTTYTGINGEIIYYVPKTTTIAQISASPVYGELKYDGSTHLYVLGTYINSLIANEITDLDASLCIYLTSIVCAKIETLDASGSSLTAKSIGDLLYNAYLKDFNAISYDFTGGNNALQSAVDTYLKDTYNGLDFDTVYEKLVTDNSGTILIDTI